MIRRPTSRRRPARAGLAAKYWKLLGPGLTTGAADDDPSGIATYSQAGAQFGLTLLWLAPFTMPLMVVVQEACARLGLVTGLGLAANIRKHSSRRTLYICAGLLVLANSFNIGADLSAMAEAVRLLAPRLNATALVIGFIVVSLSLQVLVPYAKYSKYLKYLTFVLFAYVITGFMVHLSWGEVARHALVPSLALAKDQALLVCAVLGTTISPYLFFWQASQEVEEEVRQGKLPRSPSDISPAAIGRMRLDTWSGMIVSNVIMFFIIAVCGSTLFAHGITNIATAADAAAALRPLAGEGAYLLFALGIIGTGLLAIPVLAGSSAYALSETFKQKEGLYRKFRQAHFFYGVLILSTICGLLLTLSGLDPMKALIAAAVANGLVAPVILVVLLRLSSDRRIMGRWTNHRITTATGWLVVALMAVSGVVALAGLLL